jgi:nucleoid-associated protein YgaU
VFDPLDIQTPVRYLGEHMYAAGYAIRPRPIGLWRRAGRWVLAILVGWGLARAVVGDTAPTETTMVVQPGDTLWAIAAAHYPDADPRERVDAIEQLNGLSGPQIEAGEVLRLPS